MKLVELPSPNFDSREGQAVDMLVLHYTGMKTGKEALERLQDPAAKVSSHYVVEEDGTVTRMVAEENRAWHAGRSSWRGQTNINQRSVGIEIVNPGHEFGYRAFPEAQMKAVTELCKGICERHNIPKWNVVAHSDIAPNRKSDPGELFNWAMLAREGVGLWPERQAGGVVDHAMGFAYRLFVQPFSGASALMEGSRGLQVERMQKRLSQAGYDVPQTGQFDVQTEQVVKAFQRRFRQDKVDGKWDRETEMCLNDLLGLMQSATVLAPDSRMAAGRE